jgi:hypothetical protein
VVISLRILHGDWKQQRIFRPVVVLLFAFGCVLGTSVLVEQYHFKFDIPKIRFSAAGKGLKQIIINII